MRRYALIIWLGLGVWLLMAPWARAYGPPQPPRIFQPQPTPTPIPLPAPRAVSSPAPSTPRDVPTPGGGVSRVFLPLWQVGQPAVQAASPAASNPREEKFLYTVQPGDTLNDLAVEFGRDVKTMACARTEEGAPLTRLIPGQRILIPALSDLCHIVKAGQTLDFIAAWYGVTRESLMAVPENHIGADGKVRPGQRLLIPHARSRYRSPDEVHAPRPQRDGWWYGDGVFVWPLPGGSFWISQGFKHGKHMAVDLAAAPGTPVYAIDTGRVIKAGWSDIGYGYRVVIDHGIDYVSLYAHLSEYYVQPGDIVQKGELIGRVGSTGNSTGPHLHLEIRDHGYLIDPLLVLPAP